MVDNYGGSPWWVTVIVVDHCDFDGLLLLWRIFVILTNYCDCGKLLLFW